MILTFRPIKIWPDGWPNDAGTGSPFSATYKDTLKILDRELDHLGATDVILQVDANERDCRLDGQLRADAKVKYRGVILSFQTKRFGTLTYSCDAFTRWNKTEAWQANLRAIALGLEALRKVERYGIATRGQQYAGYKELGSGIALGARMTRDQAAIFIAERSGIADLDGGDLQWDEHTAHAEAVTKAFRAAANRVHPDVPGGDAAVFRKLVEARDILEENAR